MVNLHDKCYSHKTNVQLGISFEKPEQKLNLTKNPYNDLIMR